MCCIARVTVQCKTWFVEPWSFNSNCMPTQCGAVHVLRICGTLLALKAQLMLPVSKVRNDPPTLRICFFVCIDFSLYLTSTCCHLVLGMVTRTTWGRVDGLEKCTAFCQCVHVCGYVCIASDQFYWHLRPFVCSLQVWFATLRSRHWIQQNRSNSSHSELYL